MLITWSASEWKRGDPLIFLFIRDSLTQVKLTSVVTLCVKSLSLQLFTAYSSLCEYVCSIALSFFPPLFQLKVWICFLPFFPGISSTLISLSGSYSILEFLSLFLWVFLFLPLLSFYPSFPYIRYPISLSMFLLDSVSIYVEFLVFKSEELNVTPTDLSVKKKGKKY